MAARANKKPLGGAAVFFKDAVKAVFIAAIRANLERVFELDLFYFSIHYITCFSFTVNPIFFIHRPLLGSLESQRTQRFFILLFSVERSENNKKHALRAGCLFLRSLGISLLFLFNCEADFFLGLIPLGQ